MKHKYKSSKDVPPNERLNKLQLIRQQVDKLMVVKPVYIINRLSDNYFLAVGINLLIGVFTWNDLYKRIHKRDEKRIRIIIDVLLRELRSNPKFREQFQNVILVLYFSILNKEGASVLIKSKAYLDVSDGQAVLIMIFSSEDGFGQSDKPKRVRIITSEKTGEYVGELTMWLRDQIDKERNKRFPHGLNERDIELMKLFQTHPRYSYREIAKEMVKKPSRDAVAKRARRIVKNLRNSGADVSCIGDAVIYLEKIGVLA